MRETELLFQKIKEHEAKFVDLRFTDTRGKEQHITLPVSAIDADFIENGKLIDGSSIKGWQKINQSDLALVPDYSTVVLDPFFHDQTLIVRCNVVDPMTMQGYERDPRYIAQRAEAYLKSTGIADSAHFGPEPEFFIFQDARWDIRTNQVSHKVDSDEAHWNSGKIMEGGNIGHRPPLKGGYFPVPPVDSSQDIRSAICLTLEAMGIEVEAHHHEVASANQCEVATRFNTLTKKADDLQLLKYVVHNVAHNYGKTASFMPKPIAGDNGNGMHCHQSLMKNGENLFAGDGYAGLSELALFYIGGVIRHARALNAFTNPATNSYKRLVPGFEAPVLLAYSARNRSAAIRIPQINQPKGRRIEVRFPDPMANPYLAFSAMMLAGLDGIQNKIHPGEAIEQDLYELSPEAMQNIPAVCEDLAQALQSLENDHAFLLAGDVFSKDYLFNYIELKREEVTQVARAIHPIEFLLYYSL